jgi:hypothetical protein
MKFTRHLAISSYPPSFQSLWVFAGGATSRRIGRRHGRKIGGKRHVYKRNRELPMHPSKAGADKVGHGLFNFIQPIIYNDYLLLSG